MRDWLKRVAVVACLIAAFALFWNLPRTAPCEPELKAAMQGHRLNGGTGDYCK